MNWRVWSFLFSGCLLVLAGCGKTTRPESANQAPVAVSTATKPADVPKSAVADDWLILFDGQSMAGWESKGQVSIVNGALVLTGLEKESSCMTTKKWGEHELRFEYRFQGKQAPLLVMSEVDKASGMTRYPGTGLLRSGLVEWWACTAKLESDIKTGQRRWTIQTNALGSDIASTAAMGKDTQEVQIGFRVSPGDSLTVRNLKLKPTK
jgi:hypothetical protein